jgi:hypothetical protein
MTSSSILDPVIPLEIEQLTAGWLGEALSRERIITVAEAEVERIIWGSATKALMRVGYRDPAGDLPERICVKGPFDERLRNYYDMGPVFVAEAAFYRDVAPLLSIDLPGCFYAGEDGRQGVVILENLDATGATFADPRRPLTPDGAMAVLSLLAGLHGGTWGWTPDRFAWLKIGSSVIRNGFRAMSEGGRWEQLCARPEVTPFVPDDYRDPDRVFGAFARLCERDDRSAMLCLSHGDAHLGNIYFDRGGASRLLDWQSIALMPAMKDVAYWIAGSLAVEDRRRCERDLVQHYLAELHRVGAPLLAIEDVWDDYRAQQLQGVVWPMVTDAMQPIEIVSAMSERHMAAMSDHATLAALGF